VIIAISGKAGSGKDTVGDYLCDTYGFQQDSLAAPIKRLVQDVFVLDKETVYDRELREQPLADWEGWTVRKLLQYVGTEMFRKNISEDVWVKSLCRRMDGDGGDWVVTDVRFPNELSILKEVFGDQCLSISVVRPETGNDGAPSGMPGHESEAYDIEGEISIINEGTLGDLYSKVEQALSDSDAFSVEREVTS
jgi:hypothetical protein